MMSSANKDSFLQGCVQGGCILINSIFRLLVKNKGAIHIRRVKSCQLSLGQQIHRSSCFTKASVKMGHYSVNPGRHLQHKPLDSLHLPRLRNLEEGWVKAKMALG